MDLNQKINELNGVCGSELNGQTFYKIINKNKINHDFKFEHGLNIFRGNFTPENWMGSGAFNCCTFYDLIFWFNFYKDCDVYEVKFPDDALVFKKINKYITDKLIISNPIDASKFIKLHNLDHVISRQYINGMYFMENNKFSDDIPYYLIKSMILYDGLLLEYVYENVQTLELCIEATKQNSKALAFVNMVFFDECLDIVKYS
jgi:hypothetical protein